MRYLVIDLGSSNWKIYLAEMYNHRKISMEEIDRFFTERTLFQGYLSTNIFSIYSRVCQIIKYLADQGVKIDAIGVDSWCSDYGIVDFDSGAVSMPVFYRDNRARGCMEKAGKIMNYKDIYRLTGQRRIPDSTLCQLMAYKKDHPHGFAGNKKLLFIGDLLMYLFSGVLCSEESVASYSQLYNLEKGEWEQEVFERFRIPKGIQPPVIKPGTVIGKVQKPLADFLGIKNVDVVAPAVHDTASAAAVVPAEAWENWAFLATGSWFLMSMELDKPADPDKSYHYQLSNTGLGFGKVLLKRNITAMWLVQECKKQWEKEGVYYTYPQLAEMASQAEPFYGMLDTEYKGFYNPDNMAAEICKYLRDTGQKDPGEKNASQIVRIIYESVVFQSVRALRILEEVADKKMDVLYVIGGANQIRALNQFLADAAGILVKTGPTEASAMGNAMLQAYGKGQVSSREEIREIIKRSVRVEEFYPRQSTKWKGKYREYRELCGF